MLFYSFGLPVRFITGYALPESGANIRTFFGSAEIDRNFALLVINQRPA